MHVSRKHFVEGSPFLQNSRDHICSQHTAFAYYFDLICECVVVLLCYSSRLALYLMQNILNTTKSHNSTEVSGQRVNLCEVSKYMVVFGMKEVTPKACRAFSLMLFVTMKPQPLLQSTAMM